MAGLAGGWESRGAVVRTNGVLESCQVASRAILRRTGELVIDVALLAGHRGVFSGQGEPRSRMIELRAFPLRGGVAHCAVCGEACGLVVRVRRRVVSGQVAPGTIVGDPGELIVGMALRARCRRMLSC